MGLESYLFKMPRYKDTQPSDVEYIQSYLKYLETPDNNKYTTNYKNYYEKYYKIIPSQDKIDYYSQFFEDKYEDWDDKKEYPIRAIWEEVGYWARSSWVHNYFSAHGKPSNNGKNESCEITKSTIEEFLAETKKEINKKTLLQGHVTPVDDEGNPVVFHHYIVKNDEYEEIITELNPSTLFYWGSNYYDEEEIESLMRTKEICEKVLQVDFEKYMIAYLASY